MDVDDVERVNILALGGQDTVTVSDLSATDVTAVNVNLGAGGPANGDLLADNVVVNGSGGDDRITVSEIAGARSSILPTTIVRVTSRADPTLDTLTVNGLAGNDTIDASGLPAGLIGLTVNLGEGQAAAATTTTLSTSTAYAVFGQAEVLTATVNSPAGTPTGSVTFLDGNTVLGTAPVNAAGQAILAVSLGVGNHALTASFAGSGGFTGSSSAAATVTVNRAATTVALASSVNPAVTGQAVTFTATVAAVAPGAGTPTGTVTSSWATTWWRESRSMPTAGRASRSSSRDGAVNHPGGLRRRHSLRRQLAGPHRAGQPPSSAEAFSSSLRRRRGATPSPTTPPSATTSGLGAWARAGRPVFRRAALAFGQLPARSSTWRMPVRACSRTAAPGHDQAKFARTSIAVISKTNWPMSVARGNSPPATAWPSASANCRAIAPATPSPGRGDARARRELHRDGREEATAREDPPLQVPEERLAERQHPRRGPRATRPPGPARPARRSRPLSRSSPAPAPPST